MRELSNGWVEAEIGDLCDLKNGYAFKPSDWTSSGKKIVRIQNLNNPDAHYNHFDGEIRDRFTIQSDDLLFAWSGTPGTSFGAHIWRGGEAVLNQHIFRVDFARTLLDLKFFKLAINETLDELIAKAHGGVGLRHVTKTKFEETRISVPPLKEQRRIVEKIETLFDEIDKGVESLQAAKNTLGLYRQSLLKSAFEGRLTADWRETNADKLEDPEALLASIRTERETRYKAALNDWQQALDTWRKDGGVGRKPAKPKRPAELTNISQDELGLLPNIPKDWSYTKLANLGDLGRGKSKHRPRNDKRLFGGPYPFIQTGEVKAAGRYISKYEATYSELGLEQSKLWPTGTLCITIAANIAETAFLTFNACFPDSVVGFATFEEIITPKFVELFIKSARANIEAYAPATAQKNINLNTLETLVVPLCGHAEQIEIVRLVDEKLDAADALEAEIDAGLTRAAALQQSILKKAFSGQLVPQDSMDESARELLAHLKVEKAEKERTVKRERKTTASRKPKTKVRRPTLANLIEVLKKQNSWMSASKAVRELGIFDETPSDEVEAFYRQLKEYVEDGSIEIERRDDEDWLRLTKTEVG